jgi:hypothetical protein
MKTEIFPDGVHVVPILSSLLLSFAVFISGCVYYPDFRHPAPHKGSMIQTELRERIIKANVPFSVTRTSRANSEILKVDFALDKKGRAILFQEFGFGTEAVEWRFVLFGPDKLGPNAKVICGNKWIDANSTNEEIECHITEALMGIPLSADINFRLAGDPKDECGSEIRLPEDPCRAEFRSVGRVFYIVHPVDRPQ